MRKNNMKVSYGKNMTIVLDEEVKEKNAILV